MAVRVVRVVDAGGDVLRVFGERDVERDGETVAEPIAAIGWVSATTNHYDAPIIKDEQRVGKHIVATAGQRQHDAEPRAMTQDEKNAYAVRLLEEQNPLAVAIDPS